MIRVVVAEDQRLVRGALAALLDMEDDLQVVAQAEDGEQAVRIAMSLRPDVMLVDIEMPKLSGLEVVAQLARTLPECRTVIVTTFARPGYLQRAISVGASGYVLKDAPLESLANAIRAVYKGEKVFDHHLLVEAWEGGNPLTEREVEVLRALRRGLSTREVASECFLSEGTVRNYVSEILSKLHVENRQEAILAAERKGWI